jgi:hypothetical protein
MVSITKCSLREASWMEITGGTPPTNGFVLETTGNRFMTQNLLLNKE